MIQVVFDSYNFWGSEVYLTKLGTPLVKVDGSFYILSDSKDYDSDPVRKLKDNCVTIVDKFD